MSIQALSEYTRISKYAQYLPHKNRKETWHEMNERVMDMHRSKYSDKLELLKTDLEYVETKLKEKLILGSQRALQFGGPAILKKDARLYNCMAGYCDRTKFFSEFFWLLLCGCGVGFSVQQHHIANLPKLNTSVSNREKLTVKIEDSIEGWADSIHALISSYMDEPSEFFGKEIIFDYSSIRPEGSSLSWGGKAPGSKGLENSHKKIRDLLNHAISVSQEKLRPIQCYDIAMHISDAVLSGGIRRSATSCLFSLEDEEMMTAKTGNWFIENPQRARSNNSVILVRSEITFDQFKDIIQHTKIWGEPGFVWVDDKDTLFNPCFEIAQQGYWDLDTKKESGFQGCNLTEINGSKIKTVKDFYDACRAGAILGTLQAGYTDFHYLTETSRKIIRREALLGVSITGMMESTNIIMNPHVQRKGAKIILETNKRIAKILDINPAARATCIKPSGTASCLLGTCSGIHPHHAKKYIRRVQANKHENALKFFALYNPAAVEESVWSANKTDVVLSFLCEVPKGSITKNQMGAIDLLKNVLLTQKNWIEAGTDLSLCVRPWLRHNVSNTITVGSDEWDDVTKFIYDNRDFFACISLLSTTGDKDYPQAPFTRIFTPKEILEEYGDSSLFAYPLVLQGLAAFDNNLWKACSELIRPTIPTSTMPQAVFLTDAKEFADKYFAGDIQKTTYLLKDLYNWNTWKTLAKSYQTVDWSNYNETDMETFPSFQAGDSCAGGACELGDLGASIKASFQQ